MDRHTISGVVVTLALGAVMAGCGAGAHDATTAPAQVTRPSAPAPRKAAPVTKAEFIAKADAVCAAMHRRLAPWQRRADNASTLSALKVPLRHIAPLAAEFSRRLDALSVPPQDRAVVNRYRELVSRQASDIASIGEAATTGDVAEVTRLSQATSAYIDRQHGIAEGYGFKVCGHDASAK